MSDAPIDSTTVLDTGACGPADAVPGDVTSTDTGGIAPLVSFLRRLVAHVAGQRSYLSFAERDSMVAVIAQFDPAYDRGALSDDLRSRHVDLLRMALGQVADIGGRMATLALVSTIQLLLADNRLDDDDLNLISWVGLSVGVDADELRRAIDVVAGRSRPFGSAAVAPPAPLARHRMHTDRQRARNGQ